MKGKAECYEAPKRKISETYFVKISPVKNPTSEKCKKCKYRTSLSSTYANPKEQTSCDYILFHGVSRGCPAGDECDKFEPRGTGKTKKDIFKAYNQSKAVTCCFNCDSKDVGCHVTCEKYNQELEHVREFRKKRNQEGNMKALFHDRKERFSK